MYEQTKPAEPVGLQLLAESISLSLPCTLQVQSSVHVSIFGHKKPNAKPIREGMWYAPECWSRINSGRRLLRLLAAGAPGLESTETGNIERVSAVRAGGRRLGPRGDAWERGPHGEAAACKTGVTCWEDSRQGRDSDVWSSPAAASWSSRQWSSRTSPPQAAAG
jgi:hypothetical protein